MRLSKIIATIGPASKSPEMIRKLFKAGVNMVRINFSHGSREDIKEVIRSVREISRELMLPVAILGDLQGPKFRVGEFENHQPIMLEKGSIVKFSASEKPGNSEHITTNTPEIIEELEVDQEILLNDGALALSVVEKPSEHELICRVKIGGLLGEKKGINVPGVKMAGLVAMTEKDKGDAVFAMEQGLDYLALSFVRSYQDVLFLRRFLEENALPGKTLPQIIAKIEKPQALDEIDAIIETADGIMVARGDLGVEMKPEKVPSIQKMLINLANEAEKPVITATQILESMIQNPGPTRAEVSDVANAVFDGSDALMLSGETAVGKYPCEAVEAMARIIREAESHFAEWHHRVEIESFILDIAKNQALKFHQAIAQAAGFAARKARAKAIVVMSFSGKMARRISKRKPQKPIIALTPNESVYRQLNLLWGIYPLLVTVEETTEKTLAEAEKTIMAQGFLKKKDTIVFCAGQTHLSGITNTIKIYQLGEI